VDIVRHTHGGGKSECGLSIEELATFACPLLIHFEVWFVHPIAPGKPGGLDDLLFTIVTAIMAENLPRDGQPIQLAFSSTSAKESGNFRLLELPPDLLKSIEANNSSPFTWAIKGNPAEDAVLCTDDKTYSIRSVSLSNSVLVVVPGKEQGHIVIQDTSHELLQVTPVLPRAHKLLGLLRGREYDEGREDLDDDMLDDEQGTQSQQQVRPPVCAQRHTLNWALLKGEKGISHLRTSLDRNPSERSRTYEGFDKQTDPPYKW
jgi:hypothetical protein